MIIEIKIIYDEDAPWDGDRKVIKGDELTSAISEAIIYLQELQQKEMVV